MNNLNDQLESLEDTAGMDVILEECRSLRQHLSTLQQRCSKPQRAKDGRKHTAKRGKQSLDAEPEHRTSQPRLTMPQAEPRSSEEADALNRRLAERDRLIQEQDARIRETEERLKESLNKLQHAYQHVYRTKQEDSKMSELEDRLIKAEALIQSQRADFQHQVAAMQSSYEKERTLLQEYYAGGDRKGDRDALEVRQMLKERNALVNQLQEKLTQETQSTQELRLRLEVEERKAKELDQVCKSLRTRVEELTAKDTQSHHKAELLQQKFVSPI